MGGSARSGKTTFINGSHSPYSDQDFFHIGVTFKLIDCLINNEDNYLLQIWDFKALDGFQCVYPNFCKGARGSLLTFNVADYNSFNELKEYWIPIIREIAGDVPIILIGTKNELSRVVSDEDINKLIKDYHLNGIFYTSIDNFQRENIFKLLIKSITDLTDIRDFSIFLPELDKIFEKFVDFFSICPMCGNRNHFNYLKKLYYSRDQKMKHLKEKLLTLIEESKEYEDLYYNPIRIGIPCCKCFDQVFGAKKY